MDLNSMKIGPKMCWKHWFVSPNVRKWTEKWTDTKITLFSPILNEVSILQSHHDEIRYALFWTVEQ